MPVAVPTVLTFLRVSNGQIDLEDLANIGAFRHTPNGEQVKMGKLAANYDELVPDIDAILASLGPSRSKDVLNVQRDEFRRQVALWQQGTYLSADVCHPERSVGDVRDDESRRGPTPILPLPATPQTRVTADEVAIVVGRCIRKSIWPRFRYIWRTYAAEFKHAFILAEEGNVSGKVPPWTCSSKPDRGAGEERRSARQRRRLQRQERRLLRARRWLADCLLAKSDAQVVRAPRGRPLRPRSLAACGAQSGP